MKQGALKRGDGRCFANENKAVDFKSSLACFVSLSLCNTPVMRKKLEAQRSSSKLCLHAEWRCMHLKNELTVKKAALLPSLPV